MGLHWLTRVLSMKMEPASEKCSSIQAACFTRIDQIPRSSSMRNACSRRKFTAMLALALYSVFSRRQALSAEPLNKSAAKEAPKKQVTLKEEDLRLIEEGILRLTNKYRTEKGLNPLESSPALRFLAHHQTINMCNARVLTHESKNFPEGWRKFSERLTIVGARSGAENIAFGTILKEPDQWTRTIMKGWMNSTWTQKEYFKPEIPIPRRCGKSVPAEYCVCDSSFFY